MVVTPHKRHVRQRIDEAARIGQGAVFDQVRPVLQRHVVLLVDIGGFGDIHDAAGA